MHKHNRRPQASKVREGKVIKHHGDSFGRRAGAKPVSHQPRSAAVRAALREEGVR